MLRDILVDIPLQIITRDYAGEFALSLGSQFNAHVTGMVFDLEPALQPNSLEFFQTTSCSAHAPK